MGSPQHIALARSPSASIFANITTRGPTFTNLKFTALARNFLVDPAVWLRIPARESLLETVKVDPKSGSPLRTLPHSRGVASSQSHGATPPASAGGGSRRGTAPAHAVLAPPSPALRHFIARGLRAGAVGGYQSCGPRPRARGVEGRGGGGALRRARVEQAGVHPHAVHEPGAAQAGGGGRAVRHPRLVGDAMRCDAVRCDAMGCDGMRCDAMRCDAMRWIGMGWDDRFDASRRMR